MAAQLVGPAPTQQGALGGRQASTGCGPATGPSAFAQLSEGRMRGLVASSYHREHVYQDGRSLTCQLKFCSLRGGRVER